jgi:hypothetical protein
MTNRLLLACAASLLAATSLSADVPFQPLASFGEGGGPTDMNAEGVIAGALTLDGRLEPVIWTSVTAQPTVLPTGGLGGAATAINSSGQVVGQIPAAFGGTPTIWENGVAISLPDLGEGGNARDVNESGMVAGYVIIKGNYRAARWVNRELQLLDVPAFGPPGATVWSFANSINSSGEITGTIEVPAGAESLALRWDAVGSVQPAIGTGTETSGISIDNIGGVLVNAYFDPNGAERPGRVLDGGVVDGDEPHGNRLRLLLGLLLDAAAQGRGVAGRRVHLARAACEHELLRSAGRRHQRRRDRDGEQCAGSLDPRLLGAGNLGVPPAVDGSVGCAGRDGRAGSGEPRQRCDARGAQRGGAR